MSEGGHSHADSGHSHAAHSHAHGGSAHGHGVHVERGFVPDDTAAVTGLPRLERDWGRGRILFLDCQSGIAGDMTLAALLDLGVPREVIDAAIVAVGLPDASLTVRRGYAGALGATHVTVEAPGRQIERPYAEIKRLLSASTLDPDVRQLAARIFARLARAEAEVHRAPLEEVHFHEVGAVDAIVDIVGAAAAFCYLGATVVASPIPLGRGHVSCRHGALPLPAPAALLCLTGVPTIPAELDVELVTPTGAAILAEVAEQYVSWPRFVIERVGWGAGTRGLPDRPNALRAVLGSAHVNESQLEVALPVPGVGLLRGGAPTHVELRANVDDMTGEVASYALSQLLEAGALDAWIVPTIMKKGRPGITLCALTTVTEEESVTAVFFAETTTIGVRKIAVSRTTLPRRMVEVKTRFGNVPVKLSEGMPVRCKPELDSCAKIAQEQGIPLRLVLDEVDAAARSQLAAELEK